jgi:hypothetical protein
MLVIQAAGLLLHITFEELMVMDPDRHTAPATISPTTDTGSDFTRIVGTPGPLTMSPVAV